MTRTPGERFWEKVAVRGFDECWLWQASTGSGYGRIYVQGKLVMAHRFAYEALVGAIPEGLTIDHLCRTPLCCNPAHMEPVTKRINTLRGVGAPARNAVKTHCLNHHEFTPENTYRQPGRSSRTCRACHADRARQSRARA